MLRYDKSQARHFKKKLDKYQELLEADEYAQKSALIRFYFRVNPDKLSDTMFARRFEELMYVLKFNGTIEQKNGK